MRTPLIVFSHLRWGFVRQRPQHLVSRLAEHYRVLFVEEPVRGEGPARLERMDAAGSQVEVLCPRTPVDAGGYAEAQLPVLEALLAEHLRHEGIAGECIAWCYTPLALPLARALSPSVLVYDCMDELAAFKNASPRMAQREAELLAVADLVFTGGPGLYEARRDRHANVHCLPSGVEAEHFDPARLSRHDEQARQAALAHGALPRPRLGFFGVIDERFDVGLLGELAAREPAWQFVMVGPSAKINPRSLPQAPNIHWLGLQPYARLPYLMRQWDVCLMPFALNEATRHISPTKTLEYMAGEKPVVSTAVPDVAGLYGDLVYVARDADDFHAGCRAALEETEAARAQRIAAMRERVAEASWDAAAARVHALIEAARGQATQRAVAARGVAVGRNVLSTAQAASPPKAASVPASAGAMPAGLAPTAAEAPSHAPSAGATPRRAPRRVRHLIVGAGPTGLAAAHALGLAGEAREDVLLVEREATVGGWCRSVQAAGYTFDHAGHIMFSTDPWVLELYGHLLGDNLHWQNREAWIWSHGVYTRYPFQGSLYGLPPAVLKECLVGAIEARFGPLDGSPRTPPPPDAALESFEAFIERVWGKGIGKHFATPYNQKLWAVPLAEMETSWLGGRVPLPDLERMIEGALEPSPPPMGPNARFGYPLRGGFQALMDGFLPLLRCELALGTRVLQIDPAGRTARLDDGRTLAFDSLISTMPLPALVEACGEAAPPEVRAAARGLRSVAVRCVHLGIALPPGRERLTDKHWIYYPEPETVFHRVFVQGNASPHVNPPGGFGLTCEITHGPSKPLPCEGEALTRRAIEDCRAVGLFSADDEVQVALQVDMPGAYVVYDHARARHVRCIRDWLAGFGIVLAGRYAEWEYYNSDHAFVAGRKAAEQARAAARETAAVAA